jgi:hypothetical protein
MQPPGATRDTAFAASIADYPNNRHRCADPQNSAKGKSQGQRLCSQRM